MLLFFVIFIEKILTFYVTIMNNFSDNQNRIRMPLYSTKFHISWLEKIDSDGTPVKRWLKPGSS